MSVDNTAPSAAPARTMITINGRSIEALTPTRVDAMVEGMRGKGKLITPAQHGRRYKGIKIIGDGQPFEGPLGTRYIYNVDLLSEVALDGPKAQAAYEAVFALVDGGNATAEEIHTACREVMNAITVSFNTTSRKFRSGELIEASIDVITTKNGSLISLNSPVVMAAEGLKAEPAKKFSLVEMLGKRKATELISTPAPDATAPVTAEAINAAATN